MWPVSGERQRIWFGMRISLAERGETIIIQVAGFATHELAIHHAKHGHDFPGKTVFEYEQLAEQFLVKVKGPTTLECCRAKGDIVRYDTSTEEFGVLSAVGTIRTYFKPRPCRTAPPPCHGHPDNLEYFKSECRKKMP